MDKVKAKMSTRPPVPQSAEDFILEAENISSQVQNAKKSIMEVRYPWQEPGVRNDVIKSVNLRLREEFILKLQYLSDKTNKSQQDIIREVLLPHLESELSKISDSN